MKRLRYFIFSLEVRRALRRKKKFFRNEYLKVENLEKELTK